MHAIEYICELTKKGATEKQVVDDLPGKSDEKFCLPHTLVTSKWDTKGFTNQVSGLYQELELLKYDKSIEILRNSLSISFYVLSRART